MLSKFKELIPTIKQYKKWSMVGKVTYLSFLLAIISIIITVIIFILPYIITNNVNREELAKQLETFDKDDNLLKLGTMLQKVKDDNSLQDVYLFYKARLAMKSSDIPRDNPGKYLLQINSNSDYYIKAQKGLAWYYSTVYSEEELRSKLNEIANKIKSNNMIDPYYFFLKYMATTNKTYGEINLVYNQFVNYYKDIYNFNEAYFIEAKKPSTWNSISMREVQSLNYFFNSVLLELAEKENLTTEKTQVFTKLKNISNNTDYIMLNDGLQSLNIIYKNKEQLKNELIDLKSNNTYGSSVKEKANTGEVPITIFSAP